MRSSAGWLSVVATPIGNLDDLSPRAVTVLGDADVILCEDTRRTSILSRRFGITTPRVSLHAHNEGRVSARFIARMQAGERFALVADAGTPLLSDPGQLLVAEALAAGIHVWTVPGPSAVLAALTISGFDPVPFTFFGFVPAKRSSVWFDRVAAWPHTSVLFVSPHRGGRDLQRMAGTFGDRPAVLFRELTKLHEERLSGSVADLAEHLQTDPPKGEWTLVLGPAHADAGVAWDDALAEVRRRVLAGEGRRAAAFAVAHEFGLPSRKLYRRVLLDADGD